MKGSEVIRVDVFGYGLTYAHGQYVMSSGRVVDALPSPVVRIETQDGPTGYGESCPLGATYLPALGGPGPPWQSWLQLCSAWRPPTWPRSRLAWMPSCGAMYMLKAQVTSLCGTSWARALAGSVAEPLGGPVHTRRPLYVAVPMGDPAEMATFVSRERSLGIHRFQPKLGGTQSSMPKGPPPSCPAISSENTVTADANGGWRRQDASVAIRRETDGETFAGAALAPPLEMPGHPPPDHAADGSGRSDPGSGFADQSCTPGRDGPHHP